MLIGMITLTGNSYACNEGATNPCGGCTCQRDKRNKQFSNPSTVIPKDGTKIYDVGTFQFPVKYSEYGVYEVNAYSKAKVNDLLPGLVLVAH